MVSQVRKYYAVPVISGPDGGKMPDTDVPSWTARYLSDSVALVRDPDGLRSYPVLGVDVDMSKALQSLPIELPLTMSQQEADAVTSALGLASVNIEELAADRIGGR